jgi:hypothetical protein
MTVVALGVITVLLLAGAEGCPAEGNGSGNGKPNPGPTRLVTPHQGPPPNPNPDHGANTPGPVAGDPNPHRDERAWIIFIAWSPGKESVTIEWEVGRKVGRSREYSGGTLSPPPSGIARKGERFSVDAVWAPISYGRIDSAATIKIVVMADGKEVCEQETPFRAGKRPVAGTACVGYLR